MKGLPPSLLSRLHGVPGFDEAAFIAAHALPAATSVRLNPRKDIDLFTDLPRVPWCDKAVYLPERPIFTLDPAYHAGAYYVQEASSMFLEYLWKHLLAEKIALRVLDLCAAPGGKSTLIASLLDKKSLLVANEVIRTRASILDENMTRWGYMNTWVTSNDPRDFAKLEGYFDVIVVDAPCSGSGLFRKDERALDEWSEANVALCGERQQRVLADIWPALKEDGLLIYATCSYSPREDEEILDWLADTYDTETVVVPVSPEWGIVTTTSPTRGMTGYRFFPDKVKGEGFFIAAVRKTEQTDEIHQHKFKTEHDKKTAAMAAHLLESTDTVVLRTDKENFGAIMASHEVDLRLLRQAVYLRKTGITLGAPAGKDWIPAHEVALSVEANKEIPFLEADRDQALRFLKREDMGLADPGKGWYIVRYKGLGLGWVKNLGNRMNNYLPKHWRIRMDITDADLE